MTTRPVQGDPPPWGTDLNSWLDENITVKTGDTMTGALTITDNTHETALTITDSILAITAFDRVAMAMHMWNPGNGYTSVLHATLTGRGLTDVTDRGIAGRFSIQDDSTVVNKTITNMTRVGTTVTVTCGAHAFLAADKVAIVGVVHTFNAEVNGGWTVTNPTATTFDITVPGLSAGTYTNSGTATNRPMMTGVHIEVNPQLDRGGLTGTAIHADDVAALTVQNGTAFKGTDAIYVSTGGSWYSQLTLNAASDWGVLLNGTYALGAIQIPNASAFYARNAANTADVALFSFTSAERFRLETTTQLAESVNIVVGTVSGSMIGTAANQKLAFWGTAAAAQQVLATGTGKTVDNVITFLQSIGLCRQT